MEVNENTILICHTDLVMEGTGEIEATKGKYYVVQKSSKTMFEIIDDSGDKHEFEQHDYKAWFEIIQVSTKKKQPS